MGKIASRNVPEDSDELVNNGLVLKNVEIPPELIEHILFYVDVKSLLKCRRVCKCWNEIITNHVWRKKAENRTGCKFTSETISEWKDFYLICCGLFGRNLVKNHSGKEKFKHWQITENYGDCWAIECPPIGAPVLESDAEFENKQHCFVTSYGECRKYYTVDLIKEGFTVNILDHLQPPIEISEWYCSRFDCAAVYNIHVYLFNQSGETIDEFIFDDTLVEDRQNIWFNVKHEFKNYGQGLRKIRFVHGGCDRQFWAGHFGCKMARSCVKVKVPVRED
ncbi:F-box only protein 44-like [Sitodiplosis mosellana]|uniref:F-box only protein 44-like n=1 Tax=Sitodiplosis mosellana TaxID=263140 RepID=UPI002443AF0A|nr:F-box only protein 44-like [Sitodiplosis mosellana]